MKYLFVILLIIFIPCLLLAYVLFAIFLKHHNIPRDAQLGALQKEILIGKDYVAKHGEQVSVYSDGVKLNGYYLDNQSDVTAILIHGLAAYSMYRVPDMYFYLDRNYNVLLVDQRAHGHSGGRYFTLGLKESRDVEQWVNWAEAKQSDVRIILDGLSAGGAASICYAGRYAAKSLAAIISESCFTSLEAEINYIVKQRLHLPFFPVGSLFKWMIACFAKFDVKEVSPIADLKQTDIPILFIHGEKDTLVPFAMEDELYHASKSKLKKKIAVTNGKHELSREQGRQKCEREMGDFLTHVLQTK